MGFIKEIKQIVAMQSYSLPEKEKFVDEAFDEFLEEFGTLHNVIVDTLTNNNHMNGFDAADTAEDILKGLRTKLGTESTPTKNNKELKQAIVDDFVNAINRYVDFRMLPKKNKNLLQLRISQIVNKQYKGLAKTK